MTLFDFVLTFNMQDNVHNKLMQVKEFVTSAYMSQFERNICWLLHILSHLYMFNNRFILLYTVNRSERF